MALSPEEKSARERDRLIETAKQFSTGTYCRKFVAPLFQRMIRAEDAANNNPIRLAVSNGVLVDVHHRNGECVCVTCGKSLPWDSGIKGMHTGHFVPSRRNSILLEEDNVAPQCQACNFYRSGAPTEFRMWFEAVRGIETIERLQRLKTQSVTFSRDQLVDLRIEYSRRLKAAQSKMKGN